MKDNLAGTSAAQLKSTFNYNENGYYWINLGNGQGPQQVFCIMDSAVDGGGWMVYWGAPSGATTEAQRLSADAQNISSSPIGNYHSQSFARRSGIRAICSSTRTLVYQNNSKWIRLNAYVWNSTTHNSGTFNFEQNTSLVTANGTTDSSVEIGLQNSGTSGGGDFGIAINNDGLDHHGGSYINLNSSCADMYLYQYGMGYKTNTALSGWESTTITCNSSNENQYAFLLAMK